MNEKTLNGHSKSSARLVIGAAVVVAAFILAGGAFLLSLRSGHDDVRIVREAVNQVRREQCRQVDFDHNRERATIIRRAQSLYTFPEFKQLIATPDTERFAYDQAKDSYNAVRTTRPEYCGDYRSNPVKPFPPLREIRKGIPKTSHPPTTP